jgi:hypothetical protein
MTFGANGELDLEVVLERSKLAMPSEKDWIREDRARFTGIAVWHDGGVIDGTLASADCGHCKIPPIDAYASDCIACGHAKLTCLDIPENVLFHDAPTASCRNRPVVSFLPAPTFVLQCVAHWSDPEGESEWKFAREGVESVVESWNPGSCDRLPRLMK